MTDALSIAVSGLMAQGTRLAATASNIANASTTGALPTAQNPATTVYKPLQVSYTALAAGGVLAHVSEDANGYIPVPDASNPYANSEGLVAAPAVDLTRELVNLLEIKLLYKANLGVIKTQNKMIGDLLDTVS